MKEEWNEGGIMKKERNEGRREGGWDNVPCLKE